MSRYVLSVQIIRALLVVVIGIHGLSKITGWPAFLQKFEFVPPWLAGLTAFAEIAGVVGLLLGAGLRNGIGAWFTRLGCLAIAAVQVGAIATVHEGFFYYSGGVEYNVVLIGLCLVLAICPKGMVKDDFLAS